MGSRSRAADSQNMSVAAVLLQLFFLVLVVVGQIDPVDKPCEGSTQCIHKAECETFTQAVAHYKTLPKNSCKQKEALAELRGSVCNKKENGVCCNQCGLGQVCAPQSECTSFQAERSKLVKLSKGSTEYSTRRPRRSVASEPTRNAVFHETRFRSFRVFQEVPATQHVGHVFRSLEAAGKLAENRGSSEARTPFLESSPSLRFLGGRAKEEQVALQSM